MGRSPKISPKVQSGERSHPASIISGVMRKVRIPIPRLRTLIIVLMAGSVVSFLSVGAGGPTKLRSDGFHEVSAAIALSIPPLPICTPLVLTLSSPLTTKSPVQKIDKRVSRESLEKIWD